MCCRKREEEYSSLDSLYRKWERMADEGQINEAENELSDFLEEGNRQP